MIFNTIFMVWAEAQNHEKKSHFEIKMIKKICLAAFKFEIQGLQRKLWRFREAGLGP